MIEVLEQVIPIDLVGFLPSVIPAKAGIQSADPDTLDPRLRGDDD